MKDSRVAHRYAHALFQTAVSGNIVEAVAAEISQLSAFSERDKSLYHFLESPHVLQSDKLKLISTVFSGRLSMPMVSFLRLLIEKHRIDVFKEIASEFEELMEGYRGVVKAQVTTAVPIGDDFRNKLAAKLEAVSGKKIDMVHRIDKAIIGGIIVQLDYQIIDRSIRFELESLRHELMTIKVY